MSHRHGNNENNNGGYGHGMVIIDAAIASILSEVKSISLLKEEQRTSLKAFLDGKMFSVILHIWRHWSYGLLKRSVKVSL